MFQLMFPLLWGIKKALDTGAAGLIEDSISTDVLDLVKSIVAFSETNGGRDLGEFWTAMNNGMTAVKPFGFALVVTYFLIFLFDAAAKEQITVDSLIKVMIQLVLVITLINNLGTIIMAFFSITESLLTKITISPTGKNISVTGSEVVDSMLNGGDRHLMVFTQALGLWVVHWIAVAACEFAAITRAIEIGWKVVLAPIGVANCFEGGASSPGIRYLKGLFATILSGVALYVVLAIGFSLVTGFISGGDKDYNSFVLGAVAMLSTAGAAIGVSGKVKEVVG